MELDPAQAFVKAEQKLQEALSKLDRLLDLEREDKALFVRRGPFEWGFSLPSLPKEGAAIYRASLLHAVQEHQDLLNLAAFFSHPSFKPRSIKVIVSNQTIRFEGLEEILENPFFDILLRAIFVDSLNLLMAETMSDLLDQKGEKVLQTLEEKSRCWPDYSTLQLHHHTHLFDVLFEPKTIRAFECILTEDEILQYLKDMQDVYIAYMTATGNEILHTFRGEILPDLLKRYDREEMPGGLFQQTEKMIQKADVIEQVFYQCQGLGAAAQAQVLATLALPALKEAQESLFELDRMIAKD